MPDPESPAKLTPCTDCKSKCCHNSQFPLTVQEHDKIIAAGYPDFSYRITLPEGTFHFMDFESSPCKYLGAKGRCSIYNVRPGACRSYPAKPFVKATGETGVNIIEWKCPLGKILDETARHELKKIALENFQAIGPNLYKKIKQAYDLRGEPDLLKEMGATVTVPIELQNPEQPTGQIYGRQQFNALLTTTNNDTAAARFSDRWSI